MILAGLCAMILMIVIWLMRCIHPMLRLNPSLKTTALSNCKFQNHIKMRPLSNKLETSMPIIFLYPIFFKVLARLLLLNYLFFDNNFDSFTFSNGYSLC